MSEPQFVPVLAPKQFIELAEFNGLDPDTLAVRVLKEFCKNPPDEIITLIHAPSD